MLDTHLSNEKCCAVDTVLRRKKEAKSLVYLLILFICLIINYACSGEDSTSNALGNSPDNPPPNTADAANVKEFGAKGDGVTEDQAAFQAAIDHLKTTGGGRLYVPAGTYILHKTNPSWDGTFNIISARNIEVFGDGSTLSILKRKDITPIGDTHIVRIINSDNITFHDLGFDGSRGTADQDQMHGIYVLNSSNIILEKLKISKVRGSGTYLIGDNELFCSSPPCTTTNVTILDNVFDDNFRAGSANQGGIEDISYLDNTYSNTGEGQAIDFEPTGERPGAKNVTISGNDLGSSNGTKILALGGTLIKGENFVVSENTMEGGVQIGKINQLSFSQNAVYAGTERALDIKNDVTNVIITNNDLESDGVEVIYLSAINVSNIEISNNNIYQLSSTPESNTQAGIYSEGVGGNGFKVLNNNFIGPESNTPAFGIAFRNTSSDGKIRSNFQINANKFWGIPNQVTITTSDVNTKFKDVIISNNVYYDDGGGSFDIEYEPEDPKTFIINLTSRNNTVKDEIPSP